MQASVITTEQLSKLLEPFLSEWPSAVVMEDGAMLFDFSNTKYSLSGDNKCVLHLWSEERNIVRRVLDAELRPRALALSVLRFGQNEPRLLEISANRDYLSAASLRAVRLRYQRVLERVLQREFRGSRVDKLSTKPDLQHSFSPVYTRAVVRSGQSALAVLGVNAEENQASVDAALTFGILWLDYQREQLAGRCHVEGLRLFVPPGRSDVLRLRMAHLDATAAKWQIYELDERSEICEPLDWADCGNILTRLVRAPDIEGARQRFAQSIARIQSLVPAAEVVIQSSSEVAFRLYGLEFARARMQPSPGLRHAESIFFGIGPAECQLDESKEALFLELAGRIAERRHPTGSHNDVLYRSCPERWLESLIKHDVQAIDERLDGRFVYSQVPAFAACDRAMLDLLTFTVEGRLAVLELKADDDIHLPLQGLDYWSRVCWHQERGEFKSYGYFAGRELSSAAPLLYLVSPALRTHPANEVLLRYLSPEVEWTLVQIGERWREELRVVNRKRRTKTQR